MIDVAVAVVVNQEKKILLAKRLKHQFKADYWEFPGGKFEPGELAQHALARELLEEVNLSPEVIKPISCVEHHYPEMSVRLHVYLVTHWQGELKACLGQQLKWVAIDELKDYALPEANKEFLPTLITMLNLE